MKYEKLTPKLLDKIIDEITIVDTVYYDLRKRLKEIINSSREGVFELRGDYMITYIGKSTAKLLLKKLYE